MRIKACSWRGTASRAICRSQFLRLRLWTQKALLEQLLEQYERLDEDLKAELSLKWVWMVASQDETL